MLGAGVTNGYGRTRVHKLYQQKFDLAQDKDFEDYLQHTPNLTVQFSSAKDESCNLEKESHWKLGSFFFTTDAIHIGAGYGDEEADAINYKEKVIVWKENDKPEWKTYYVIPGTSIKGALAHRFAFYSCQENNHFVDATQPIEETIQVIIEKTPNDYEAQQKALENLRDEINNGTGSWIQEISQQTLQKVFGSASNTNTQEGAMGKLIVEDVYIPEEDICKTLFQHNSIDRFTGGTIDGALYSERVYAIKKPVALKLWTHKDIEEKTALNKAINDLKEGRLPIGGNTTNGNGFLKKFTNEDC